MLLATPIPPEVIIEPVLVLVEFDVSVVFIKLDIPTACDITTNSFDLTLHWSKVSVSATLAVMAITPSWLNHAEDS